MPKISHELEHIGKLTDENVEQIRTALHSSAGQILSPQQLVAVIAEVSDVEVAAVLVGNLIRLHQVSRRIGESPTDVVSQQQASLATSDELGDRSELTSGFETLRKLVSVTAVQLATKAIDVSYDCDNLLRRSRILTDVRPIFSDDAADIDGAIVAHTLRLRYDSAGNDNELSLAMDATDLRKLILQCERALLKEQTSRKQLIERADVISNSDQEAGDE